MKSRSVTTSKSSSCHNGWKIKPALNISVVPSWFLSLSVCSVCPFVFSFTHSHSHWHTQFLTQPLTSQHVVHNLSTFQHFVSLSTSPYLSVSVCLSVCLCVSLSLPISLSLYPFLSLSFSSPPSLSSLPFHSLVLNRLQIIDHLCAVSLLSEEGHSVNDAEEALFFNEGKEKLARKFLKVTNFTRTPVLGSSLIHSSANAPLQPQQWHALNTEAVSAIIMIILTFNKYQRINDWLLVLT